MKITVLHPLSGAHCDPALLAPEGFAAFARAADEGGFDALAMTEHPAPPTAWLEGGGHGSLDPFASLGYAAAVTSRVRLMTYLLVLPYRSPMAALKAATTLDLLSAGRLTLTVGPGYLKSEFRNLGVDFDDRGSFFEESLRILKQGWGSSSFSFTGEHTSIRDAGLVPAPVQDQLPVLVGGNSAAARRRAATLADGWSPLVSTPERSAANRTEAITTVAELGAAIVRFRQTAADAGRDASSLLVQTDIARGPSAVSLTDPPEQILDMLGQLADVGVGSMVVRPDGSSLARCLDEMGRFSEQVISAQRAG